MKDLMHGNRDLVSTEDCDGPSPQGPQMARTVTSSCARNLSLGILKQPDTRDANRAAPFAVGGIVPVHAA